MTTANYRRSLEFWLDNDLHRNRYCDEVDNPDPSVAELTRLGLMRLGYRINGGRDALYFATDEGIRTARAAFASRRKAERAKEGGD